MRSGSNYIHTHTNTSYLPQCATKASKLPQKPREQWSTVEKSLGREVLKQSC